MTIPSEPVRGFYRGSDGSWCWSNGHSYKMLTELLTNFLREYFGTVDQFEIPTFSK